MFNGLKYQQLMRALVTVIFFTLGGCMGDVATVSNKAPAKLSVTSDLSFDFDRVLLGEELEMTITLTNNGDLELFDLAIDELFAPFSYKGDGYPGTGGDCATTIASESSCTIVLIFAPDELLSYSANFVVNYNSGIKPEKVSKLLKGRGVEVAAIKSYFGATQTEGILDFGNVITYTTATQTVTLKNEGGLDATALVASTPTNSFSYLGGSYPGTGGTCGTTLNENQTCTVVLSFAPTTEGQSASAITFSYNNGSELTTLQQQIKGTGLEDCAKISITNNEEPIIDFDDRVVNNPSKYTTSLILQNIGPQKATSLNFAYASNNDFSVTHNCPSSGLAANQSCTLNIVFNPQSANVDTIQTNDLTISYYDNHTVNPQTKTLEREVQGRGVNPGLLEIEASSSSSLDNGQVEINLLKTSTYNIKNSGSFKVTSLTIPALAAPYTIVTGQSSCKSVTQLLPQEKCSLRVEFRPTAVGDFTQELAVTYNDGKTAAQTNFKPEFEGEGVVLAHIELHQQNVTTLVYSKLEDGGAIAYPGTFNGENRVYNFKVINKGTGSGSLVGLSNTGAPFSITDSGSCIGSTLAVNAECLFSVTFAPTNADPNHEESYSGDNLVLVYDDGQGGGATNQTDSFPLSGTMTLPADISFLDESLATAADPLDIGDTNPGTPLTYPVTIKSLKSDPANNISITLIGAGPITISTDSALPSKCSTSPFSLGQNETCIVYLVFAPGSGVADNTAYNAQTLSVDFTDGNSDLNTKTLDINALVKFRAVIKIYDVYDYVTDDGTTVYADYEDGVEVTSTTATRLRNTGVNDSNLNYFVIVNEGKASATGITLGTLNTAGTLHSYSPALGSATLAPSATATFRIQFAPTQRNFGSPSLPTGDAANSANGNNKWVSSFTLDYNDGVGAVAQETMTLNSYAYAPAKLEVRENVSGSVYKTSFDYGEVPKLFQVKKSFIVKNTGEMPATDLDYSVLTSADNIFIESGSSSCVNNGTLLATGPTSLCTIDVTFQPKHDEDSAPPGSNIYGTATHKIHIEFLGGVADGSNNAFDIGLAGTGIKPIANFFGWSKITATTGNSTASLDLRWDKLDMPSGFPEDHDVRKYNVFRSKDVPLDMEAINETDVSGDPLITPYRTITVLDQDSDTYRKLVDTNLTIGSTYYYTVRPVVWSGADEIQIGVVEDWAKVAIIMPPRQMALVHRWAANREICELLGFEVRVARPEDQDADYEDPPLMDPEENFSCNGGKKYNTFDLAGHLFIDKYELSASGSVADVYPIKGIHQYDALGQTSTSFTPCIRYVESINGQSYNKRSLTRKEQFVAMAGTPKASCNVSSGALAKTGENPLCVSNYGIYDMIGNLAEWTLDWVMDSVGRKNTSGNIPTTAVYNSSVDQFRFNHSTSEFNSAQCYAVTLGLPVNKDTSGNCIDGALTPAEIDENYDDITDKYFSTSVSNSILGPRGIVSGGSYATGETASGRWSLDMRRKPADIAQDFGTRCGFLVEEN